MGSRGSRNNIMAGSFLLGGLTLTLAVIVTLSGAGDVFTPRSSYEVLFDLRTGAGGLDEGSPVKLGGMEIGSVTETSLVFDEQGEPTHIRAIFEARSDVVLYQDARIHIARPLLGSGAQLNITAITGRADEEDWPADRVGRLPEGGQLLGSLAPPAFLSPDDYEQFQNLLARASSIAEQIDQSTYPTVVKANDLLDHAGSVASGVDESFPMWETRVSSILSRVDTATAELDGITGSVQDTLAEARALLAGARSTIDDNRESFSRAVQNVESLTEKLDNELYDEALTLTDNAARAAESIAAASSEIEVLLTEQSHRVRDAIANATLASQQLKLLAAEVRAAPWRLLYQPTRKELEAELLYNSIRQYAQVVSDLRQASAELDALSRLDPERAPIGQARLQETVDTIEQTLAELKQREAEFFENWPAGGAPPGD